MMTRIFTQPVNQFSAEMDRLFDALLNQSANQTFGRSLPRPTGRFLPPMNIWETDQNLVVEVELPGMSMENIELLVQGDQLTLRGQRQAVQAQHSFIRQERWAGQFERTVTLPVSVDHDQAEASLQHGVLTITLPKAQAARARRIEIKSLPTQTQES